MTAAQSSQMIFLHSPHLGTYAIRSFIDFLQPELARIASAAGHLLQMCKAALLQKLAMEATTNASRKSPEQINAEFASLSKAYASDAVRKITMAKTERDNALSIARHINRARLEIAAKGAKQRASPVNELAPGGANLAPTRPSKSSQV